MENVSQLEFICKLEDGWGDRDDCIAVPARVIAITRSTMLEFIRLRIAQDDMEAESKFRITPGFDGEIDVALMPTEYNDGPVMVTFSEETMFVCEARYKFVPTVYEFENLPGHSARDGSWMPSCSVLAGEIYAAEQRAVGKGGPLYIDRKRGCRTCMELRAAKNSKGPRYHIDQIED
jgi:hypothetical protein